MGRSKTAVIDEDGNELTPPEPGSTLAQVIYLLEYGRKRGFQIGPALQVGDIIVQVRDLREKGPQQQSRPDVEPGSDMAKVLGLEE